MPEPTITTARTPRLSLPYLFPGQAQKEAFVNEGFARLDALTQPAVIAVLSSPPADPMAGDCYLVGTAPGGAWLGRAGQLAIWAENQWLFQSLHAGALVFDTSRSIFLRRSLTGEWIACVAPALPQGGTGQDADLRAAVAAIVAELRHFGIFA